MSNRAGSSKRSNVDVNELEDEAKEALRNLMPVLSDLLFNQLLKGHFKLTAYINPEGTRLFGAFRDEERNRVMIQEVSSHPFLYEYFKLLSVVYDMWDKMRTLIPTVCPHCKQGKLEEFHGAKFPLRCSVCHRGWFIDRRGNLLAGFDAGSHVYAPDGRLLAAFEDAAPFYEEAGLT